MRTTLVNLKMKKGHTLHPPVRDFKTSNKMYLYSKLIDFIELHVIIMRFMYWLIARDIYLLLGIYFG
jgi:hypothetical protein